MSDKKEVIEVVCDSECHSCFFVCICALTETKLNKFFSTGDRIKIEIIREEK